MPPGVFTGIEYKEYRKNALLDNVRGSPGQIYTSSIYYLEGYIESAFAVSIKDAAATIDIASKVSQDVRLPSIYQVRLCKASTGTLAFTQLAPIAAVFEVGMIHDERTGDLRLYYGAADSCIAMATASMSEVLDYLLQYG